MTERSVFELKLLPTPTRKSRVETYLWDARDGNAETIAETMHDAKRPLAKTVVLIPVGAEQEKGNIAPALREYAEQADCEPFTVALLLNYRRGLSDDKLTRVRETIDEAHRLQKEYEDMLDVRVAIQEYDEPVIGQIRKDLWDAALSLAHTEGAFDTETGEVIGINHDIDTVAIDPHYIANVQREYVNLQREATMNYVGGDVLPPRYTHVRHHKPYDTHPHTAAGIYWLDTAIDQVMDFGGYEEGIVMPLTHYARRGGFSRQAKTYETEPFIRNMRANLGTIACTDMYTSPRRYIDRFPKHGYGGIWSNESFSDSDDCRDTEGRDATARELTQHVGDVLTDHLSFYYLAPAVNLAFKEVIRDQAAGMYNESSLVRFLEVAENALETRIARSMHIAERALQFMGLRTLSTIPSDKKILAAAVREQLAKIEREVRELNKDVWDLRSGR